MRGYDLLLLRKLAGGGGSEGIIDVSTAAELDAKLTAENVGKVYRYTGTTDANYTNGDLYVVRASE